MPQISEADADSISSELSSYRRQRDDCEVNLSVLNARLDRLRQAYKEVSSEKDALFDVKFGIRAYPSRYYKLEGNVVEGEFKSCSDEGTLITDYVNAYRYMDKIHDEISDAITKCKQEIASGNDLLSRIKCAIYSLENELAKFFN